jgi:hypothetical protein
MDCRLREVAEQVGADTHRFAEAERHRVELVRPGHWRGVVSNA